MKGDVNWVDVTNCVESLVVSVSICICDNHRALFCVIYIGLALIGS